MICKDCSRPIENGRRCEQCSMKRRARIWDGVKKGFKTAGPIVASVVLAIISRGRVTKPGA